MSLASDMWRDCRARQPEAKRITDKMPANFFCVGLIHLMLPNAKIIHVNRNPVDTCLSVLHPAVQHASRNTLTTWPNWAAITGLRAADGSLAQGAACRRFPRCAV